MLGYRCAVIGALNYYYAPATKTAKKDPQEWRTLSIQMRDQGVQLATVPAHEAWARAVRVSPDGKTVASCGDDGAIKLWDMLSHQHLATLRAERPYERLDISGTSGLTNAQRVALQALGAVGMEHALTPEQVLPALEPTMATTTTLTGPSSTSPGKIPAPYPDGLTVREVEVLRLIAQGLTNDQVAEQLVISSRTVNTHLTAIYGKIGVSSRSGATRYAMEHHLV